MSAGRRGRARQIKHRERATGFGRAEPPIGPGLAGGTYRPLADEEVTRVCDAALDLLATLGVADPVPAMLTPGEFVRSKDAVKSHGMGFMKQLNQGKIQGFNQGGPVYRQRGGGIFGRGRGGGGAMSVDTSAISQAFETFNTNLSEIFNQAMPAFKNLTRALNNLGAAWSQGFVMTHQMNVNGGLNLPGINRAAIGEQIASALGENVAGQVEGLIKAQGDQFRTA